MSDFLSKEERSAMMSKIRSYNTKPERDLRNYLWKNGFRYRINVRKLPGSPDIVLRKYKTAIFVHGCFWHGHDCKDFHLPKTNTEFWERKISLNQSRDTEAMLLLENDGWQVIVVWECELKKKTFLQTADMVKQRILSNYSAGATPKPL